MSSTVASKITNTLNVAIALFHTLAMHDIGRNYCELRKNNRIQKSNNCYNIHSQIDIM
jgi:hypothetical protein